MGETMQANFPRCEDASFAIAAVLRRLPGAIVAIDGCEGVGKTMLARHLALRLGAHHIETDRFLRFDPTRPVYRYGDLGQAIAARRARTQPLIVEGIAILDLLDRLDLEPGFVILVCNAAGPRHDFLPDYFREYEERFQPARRADLILTFSAVSPSVGVHDPGMSSPEQSSRSC